MQRTIYVLFCFFMATTLFITPSTGVCWQGKVVGVSDGDTIAVMHDGKVEKTGIYGIDCPEGHQDFGSRAKQFTSDMVFGKMVDVKRMDTDRYGRTVGIVTIDGKTLNEGLLNQEWPGFSPNTARNRFADSGSNTRKKRGAAKSAYGQCRNPFRLGILGMAPSPLPRWNKPKNHKDRPSTMGTFHHEFFTNPIAKVRIAGSAQSFSRAGMRQWWQGTSPVKCVNREMVVI